MYCKDNLSCNRKQVGSQLKKCLYFGKLIHDPESFVLVDKCKKVSALYTSKYHETFVFFYAELICDIVIIF
jgi:hypothetical protein